MLWVKNIWKRYIDKRIHNGNNENNMVMFNGLGNIFTYI